MVPLAFGRVIPEKIDIENSSSRGGGDTMFVTGAGARPIGEQGSGERLSNRVLSSRPKREQGGGQEPLEEEIQQDLELRPIGEQGSEREQGGGEELMKKENRQDLELGPMGGPGFQWKTKQHGTIIQTW